MIKKRICVLLILLLTVFLLAGCTAEKGDVTINSNLSGKAVIIFSTNEQDNIDQYEDQISERLNAIGVTKYNFSTFTFKEKDKTGKSLRLDMRWADGKQLNGLLQIAMGDDWQAGCGAIDRGGRIDINCPTIPIDNLILHVDGDIINAAGESIKTSTAEYQKGQSVELSFQPSLIPNKLKTTLLIGVIALVVALGAVYFVRVKGKRNKQQ